MSHMMAKANKTTSGLMRKIVLIFIMLVILFILALDSLIPDVVQ